MMSKSKIFEDFSYSEFHKFKKGIKNYFNN